MIVQSLFVNLWLDIYYDYQKSVVIKKKTELICTDKQLKYLKLIVDWWANTNYEKVKQFLYHLHAIQKYVKVILNVNSIVHYSKKKKKRYVKIWKSSFFFKVSVYMFTLAAKCQALLVQVTNVMNVHHVMQRCFPSSNSHYFVRTMKFMHD